tara:strand:+ start:2239 stop:2550 length:312 start_codon:yes stop_codon:yes gene_type:complete
MTTTYDSKKLMTLSRNNLETKQLGYILEVLTKESNKHKDYLERLIETQLSNIPFLYRQAFQEYVNKCDKEQQDQEKLLNLFGQLFNDSQTQQTALQALKEETK